MIVLMLLGIIMAFHYITVDSEKAAAIAQEGSVMKNALQIEGSKSAARNVILLSAYDNIDKAISNDPAYIKTGDNLDTIDGLKRYLEQRITKDLNSVDSVDPNDASPNVGTYDKVNIDYKDDKGNTRKDGFVVSAVGEHYGVPVKIEKFVDSGIFGYYDKFVNYKKNFYSELGKALTCRLGSITCATNTDWLKRESMYCKSPTNDEGEVLYSLTSIPGEHYLDADEVVNRIKEALIDVAKKEAKGLALSDYKKSNAPVVFNVDYIDATVDIKPRNVEGECCDFIYGDKSNECKDDKYEELQQVSLTVSGKIHFKEMYMLGDGTIKPAGDGFEVCAKTPIMTKDGTVKALKFSETEFDLPYAISLSYRTPCDPDKVKKAYSKIGPLQEGEYIPGFKLNQDSLKFTLTPVNCKWEDDGSYAPECAKARELTRSDWERCSSCKNACYYDENVPNSEHSIEWYCPADPNGPWYPKD